MRMSCNGCRVLRKGCSDACTIRPCLQWIKTPEAQANATVFLAKFYGRAGLLNLLAAPGPGADHLRPAVFRSLLYEACGRIVNPVYGSVGLLWSGQWQACQAAVEAVLKGEPVVRVAASSSSESEANATPPIVGTATAKAACDIRHVAKASRTKFKRASSSTNKPTNKQQPKTNKQPDTTTTTTNSHSKCASPRLSTPTQSEPVVDHDALTQHDHDHDHEESAGSHQHPDQDHDNMSAANNERREEGSSEDTEAEAGSHVSQADEHHSHQEDDEVGLDLTLGLSLVPRPTCDLRGLSAASSLMGLRLELPA